MLFDVEADGLLDEATKIHVLSYKEGSEIKSTHDYDEMRKFFTQAKLLIGHNIICYDIPLVEKLLGIKVTARAFDTLALSWYLNHTRIKHGLESYGEDYGIPKPVVDDWKGLSPEEYRYRCEEDVKINSRLWLDLKDKLLDLYGSKQDAERLLDYLSFKMFCLKKQADSGWKLDKKLAEETLAVLLIEQEEKIEQLKAVMPKVPQHTKRTKPSKPYKKDGTLSVAGAKWLHYLKEYKLPEDCLEFEELVGEVEPNPNSHDQVKNWLFSLGWKPQTYKFVRDNNTRQERKIPQVRVEGDEGKELCPSVLELVEEHPEVSVLEGLTVLQHRTSILEGFLRDESNGRLIAGGGGLTNTLRFKHRVLVNLPGVNKPYGDKIRGCLIADKGKKLCGSDMMSLEENTKKHYMYKYDPEFVEEMSKEGFDAHLDLAKHAGVVNQIEIDEYVNKVPGAKNLKPVRSNYKVANYACIYGVKPPKLSRETGLNLKEAEELINAYWRRNWSVKRVSEDVEIKELDGGMWLKNPVSNLWYSLRHKKDIFSTLNQGTGVYCFDTWIKWIFTKRPQLTGQFHDEIILSIKEGAEDKCTQLLNWAIDKANEELQLNIKLSVDIQYGYTYADIH